MDAREQVTVWYNPRCSKCRALRALLEERGVEAVYRDYLAEPPTGAEVARLLAALGLDDPLPILRSGEPAFAELGLAEAGREARAGALTSHPALLQRPILERGGRAVVARPPERGLDLLD
ncbi:MAG: ArsC/Spx/MgsR family protein [Planctomycetota bacterium]